MQIPQQELGIKILIADFADPAHSPGTEILDDRAEFLACRGERVRDFASLMTTLHYAGPRQIL